MLTTIYGPSIAVGHATVVAKIEITKACLSTILISIVNNGTSVSVVPYAVVEQNMNTTGV